MSAAHFSEWDVGEYLKLDDGLIVRVVMVRIHSAEFSDYCVEWWNNGALQTAYVDGWRLKMENEK